MFQTIKIMSKMASIIWSAQVAPTLCTYRKDILFVAFSYVSISPGIQDHRFHRSNEMSWLPRDFFSKTLNTRNFKPKNFWPIDDRSTFIIFWKVREAEWVWTLDSGHLGYQIFNNLPHDISYLPSPLSLLPRSPFHPSHLCVCAVAFLFILHCAYLSPRTLSYRSLNAVICVSESATLPLAHWIL